MPSVGGLVGTVLAIAAMCCKRLPLVTRRDDDQRTAQPA